VNQNKKGETEAGKRVGEGEEQSIKSFGGGTRKKG